MTDEHGTAGASARREYERRKTAAEARVRQRWGRLGGLAVALSDEPRQVTAWRTGADGEEIAAKALARIASDDVRIMHDRRLPRSRANIDHIVVSRSGVWVIDAKNYTGRPQLRVRGGVLHPRTETLVMGGRDQTKLVDGVLAQMSAVRSVVGDVPVLGALCFVKADWPLIGGAFQTRDVHVVWPNRLLQLISDRADTGVDVEAVGRTLARVFPPA